MGDGEPDRLPPPRSRGPAWPRGRTAIIDQIGRVLKGATLRDTRNCKPMRRNAWGTRELRVAPQRVLFDVDSVGQVVAVQRVLTKPGAAFLDSEGREVDLDGSDA